MGLQERIRIPEDKMDYYKDLAEMYVGDDVSPDFYGWVFPKCGPPENMSKVMSARLSHHSSLSSGLPPEERAD